jgi:hypothetical protein
MKRNKVSIGTYLYWSKNLASMLYSKLLLLFGVRLSTSAIPEGPYCYTPDYEKNKIAESFTYYVIPCKYYKTLGKRWNGCKYLGIITDDFVFDDQCKMCGENYGDNDE